jgi:putative SOS response-associated peptidase YedK
MCGRFSLTATPEEVQELFGLEEIEDFPPRYNIAPTQPILIVAGDIRREEGDNRTDRRALLARWGLLPGWVKDPADFPLLINARSETAAEKASFRAAMRHRRILVAASGFYEWHRPPKGSKQKSTPYWIKPRAGRHRRVCRIDGNLYERRRRRGGHGRRAHRGAESRGGADP